MSKTDIYFIYIILTFSVVLIKINISILGAQSQGKKFIIPNKVKAGTFNHRYRLT